MWPYPSLGEPQCSRSIIRQPRYIDLRCFTFSCVCLNFWCFINLFGWIFQARSRHNISEKYYEHDTYILDNDDCILPILINNLLLFLLSNSSSNIFRHSSRSKVRVTLTSSKFPISTYVGHSFNSTSYMHNPQQIRHLQNNITFRHTTYFLSTNKSWNNKSRISKIILRKMLTKIKCHFRMQRRLEQVNHHMYRVRKVDTVFPMILR